MKKISSQLALIKKALNVWIFKYHFVIPKDVLKLYIKRFRTENETIQKYGRQYYDPKDVTQYQEWLSYQTYHKTSEIFTDITFVGKKVEGYHSYETNHVDFKKIKTKYICLLDEDVTLYLEFFSYLNELEGADVIYFDNDKIQDGQRCNPILKPDFSYNTLRGINYIGDLIIIKTELLVEMNLKEINIHSILLALSDQKLTWKHIEKILYGETKAITYQKDVVLNYFEKKGIHATIESHEEYGIVSYSVKGNPRVSILIPTKDGKNDLERCITSIYEKTTYSNFEVLIIDNNSSNQETFDYFDYLKKEHDNLSIIRMEIPFNFSTLNNEAVKQCTGEYVLLLNNDTKVITNNWIELMLGYAQLEKTGTVGTKLLYEDNTIQHAGVIAGKNGGFAHRYCKQAYDIHGYLHNLDIPNDVFANTAACLMVSKKKYEEVGSMNEELSVQFNDIDLNIKLLENGYSNIFLPTVMLYHYESKSRGLDKNPESVKRMKKEVQYAEQHFPKWLKHDPYYNDNFDKNYDFMLTINDNEV